MSLYDAARHTQLRRSDTESGQIFERPLMVRTRIEPQRMAQLSVRYFACIHLTKSVKHATPEVYERQRAEFEPIREIPQRYHLRLDTTRDREHLVSEIEAALERVA
jgi:hypothetical protein